MIWHILTWLFKSLAVFLLGIPVTLLGLPVVALALPFRTADLTTLKPFTQYRGDWCLVRLPRWALWWDNAYDGALGDKRGWWDNYTGDCRSFSAMWDWLAIRNPANYWSRNIAGVDVSDCVIEKLAGMDEVIEEPGLGGWQFLVATSSSGARYHRLFVVLPWWFDATHAVLIDVGWKVKLSHNGTSAEARPQDRFKGSVFTLSPWKELA